jgi:ech hydrogenase subunit D
MIEQQENIIIPIEELSTKVQEFYAKEYRLVQIGCTKTEGYELNYSFDQNYHYINLRIILNSTDTPVPSVSDIYGNAFLYENEIHDLFGISFSGLTLDYKGTFYKTSIKTPFK